MEYLTGPRWSEKLVHIECDNMAVVHVLNKGATRDTILAKIVRNIWLEFAGWYIELIVIHIEGNATSMLRIPN